VAVVTVPTVSPAVVMAVVAADCVDPRHSARARPTRGRTPRCFRSRRSCLPLGRLMMLPIATVGLFALVTAPTGARRW
jgi:hypothetical protein